jgi:PAS domain S-box-containing protein
MANILIVEDENIVAWDIKETLEKLGHTVVDLVMSGTEALRAAQAEHPDLVLMDIRLDGAMDGITAGNEIYHQFNIPIVYLTAHTDEYTLDRATHTNPFGYIVKPFQPRSLHSTIQIALHRHQLEASAHRTPPYLPETLNSIGRGIIATDLQGLITFINPIAETLTGWTQIEALGQEIGQIFRLIWESDGSKIENPNLRAMRLNQPAKSDERCWLVTKDGSEIPICDTATPILDRHGEILGSVVIFKDNSEQLLRQVELWDRNQELEKFQLKLISLLQEGTTEYQQAIAVIQVLDCILKQVDTATKEGEILNLALQQLGNTLDIDYGWVALHNAQNATSSIICEYINLERQLVSPNAIGTEIDLGLYPQFYRHLIQRESWIAPPLEIVPKPYLNFGGSPSEMLICPIVVDRENCDLNQPTPSPEDKVWTIGEVGILTTGKPLWTTTQASLIAQIFSYTVKL